MIYQMKRVFIIKFSVTLKKFEINKSIINIGKHINIQHKMEHKAQINEHIAAYMMIKVQRIE